MAILTPVIANDDSLVGTAAMRATHWNQIFPLCICVFVYLYICEFVYLCFFVFVLKQNILPLKYTQIYSNLLKYTQIYSNILKYTPFIETKYTPTVSSSIDNTYSTFNQFGTFAVVKIVIL